MPLDFCGNVCYNSDIDNENEKRHRIATDSVSQISDIRKGVTSTDAELGVIHTDSAAPLRIWLICPYYSI
jgi:hypothetical protein